MEVISMAEFIKFYSKPFQVGHLHKLVTFYGTASVQLRQYILYNKNDNDQMNDKFK